MSPMIAFKVSQEQKRAIELVAADLGTGVSVSSLLREAVDQIIKEHRDGLFF